MNKVRWGVLTGSLAAGLVLGGSAFAQTAQRPDRSPSATQPSPAAPDNSAQPMSEQPGMSNSQDQQPSPQVNEPRRDQDNMGQNPSRTDRDPMSANGRSDTTQKDVKEFDHFLDKHPQVAQDLRSDPSKVNDSAYVSDHKELQHWLEKHPQVRDEIRENPSAFMHQENRYEKNENKPQ
jgi:hypothetical protein